MHPVPLCYTSTAGHDTVKRILIGYRLYTSLRKYILPDRSRLSIQLLSRRSACHMVHTEPGQILFRRDFQSLPEEAGRYFLCK